MARIANTTETVRIPASDLHAADLLVLKTGEAVHVSKVKRMGATVKVTYAAGYQDIRKHVVDADYQVTVHTERECDCDGSGRWTWGGTVNGVPVHEGVHFACDGKGYQDRQDLIRNLTYWNKYARITF